MFLSKLTLNLKNRRVQADLLDCQKFHSRVMAAFPQAPAGTNAREHFGVLYRLDFDRRGVAVLLVQSHVEPDWARFLEMNPSYLAAAAECKDVAGKVGTVRTGQVLSFRLRANVTRRVADKDKHGVSKRGAKEYQNEWTGKRVEIWDETTQIAWLKRKAIDAGVEVVQARLSRNGQEYDAARAGAAPRVLGKKEKRPEGKSAREETVAARRDYGPIAADKRRLVFGGVTFEGLLRVTDAGKLRDALARGIGPAKAYGFGLLSLGPPR